MSNEELQEATQNYLTILRSNWSRQIMSTLPPEDIGMPELLQQIIDRPTHRTDKPRWFMAQGLALEDCHHQVNSLSTFLEVMNKVLVYRQRIAYNRFRRLNAEQQLQNQFIWKLPPISTRLMTVQEKRKTIRNNALDSLILASTSPNSFSLPNSVETEPAANSPDSTTPRPTTPTTFRRNERPYGPQAPWYEEHACMEGRRLRLHEREQRQLQRLEDDPLQDPSYELLYRPDLLEVDYWLWTSRVNELWRLKDVQRQKQGHLPLSLYTTFPKHEIEIALLRESNHHHSHQRAQALLRLQSPDNDDRTFARAPNIEEMQMNYGDVHYDIRDHDDDYWENIIGDLNLPLIILS